MNKIFEDFVSTMEIGAKRCGRGIVKRGPELLLVGGGILLVKGIVDCCKATPKHLKDKSDHELVLEGIKIVHDRGDLSDEEEAVELTKEYSKYAVTTAKTFVKGGMECAVGFGAAVGAVAILRHQNNELEKTLITLGTGLLAYRGRVRDYVGEEKEYDLFHNIKREMVEEEYTDEKGKKKKRQSEQIVNEGEQIVDIGDHNSIEFKPGCFHFQDMLSNVYFIEETEKMLNKMLVGRGDGGKMEREEVKRFFKDERKFPLEDHKWGWVYLKDQLNNYLFPYEDDPYVPQIIKLRTSKDFGVTKADTIIEMNCYPIDPVLEKVERKMIVAK